MARFLISFWRRVKYYKFLKNTKRKASREPENLHYLIRIGDLLDKLGKRREAIEVYWDTSRKFAQKGLFRQAIALNRLILRLNPLQTEVQQTLIELYNQQQQLLREKKSEQKEISQERMTFLQNGEIEKTIPEKIFFPLAIGE